MADPTKRDLSVVSGGTEVYETEFTDVPVFHIGAACTVPGFTGLRVSDVRTSLEGAYKTKYTTTVTYTVGAPGTAGGGGTVMPWDLPPDISISFQDNEVESVRDARGKRYRNSNNKSPMVKPTRPISDMVISITRNVNATISTCQSTGMTYNNMVNEANVVVNGTNFLVGELLCKYSAAQKYQGDTAYCQESITLLYREYSWKQLLLDEGIDYSGNKRLSIRDADNKPMLGSVVGGVHKAGSYYKTPFRLNGDGKPLLAVDPTAGGGLAAQGEAHLAAGNGANGVKIAESDANGVFLEYWMFDETNFSGLDLP